ncbi:Aromatic ring-opening dioxygenase, catalytic subunit, LigB family [Streptoalloteichus tenebrarius]|uniref:Aromatic ring-opening dioxygenase, catalytic subunit, LigB family n=1 Tax=Streptoalloteichus tenebrarius (strain ATCC 17920 / DSM 40477 / JCM 4838 / CBS 697.72 / NBRC 16177 / NCIMB 11028 / NRRL B-12390 / A12253. 1 / ISP 5477) TaxID=1933 RepID=A0ABT1HSG5_STRSD|nr:class III extradiol ring-cleavage dioxygenase [Streptoalloteichus tenebrarius]MCP2258451.1 Aromatic ring-opening dioxygenase, catalytic subunit, LigB family [Streptoalloteichus tenebrarius]BFF03622.1 class III extradiol ring-cleavage dioxygenase [Streptoalloteichus tenebrarius]
MDPTVTTATTTSTAPGGRMPVLYLGHGAPPLADDPLWTRQLAGWAADLPRPEAVLIVSAHWEEAPLTVGATTTVPLVYDFWGFPERYYQVRYPAPGAPRLAEDVRKLLRSPATPVHDEPERGLDHGAYVPLVEMYPEADVPVLQISMPTLDPRGLVDLGRRLAPLRDQGVLIVGSGFMTHNLRAVDLGREPDYAPPTWSSEFDDWVERALSAQDVDALLDFRHKAPAARTAHPRTEHFAPLFVALGAALDRPEEQRSVIDGYWYGLSKRSVQFG